MCLSRFSAPLLPLPQPGASAGPAGQENRPEGWRADWDFLQHGLLQGSFVPPQPIQQLRDLTRSRTTLKQEQVRIGNRIRKVLEDANLKLSSVMSDVMGVSGREMLRAIVGGESDPAALAQLAQTPARKDPGLATGRYGNAE